MINISYRAPYGVIIMIIPGFEGSCRWAMASFVGRRSAIAYPP